MKNELLQIREYLRGRGDLRVDLRGTGKSEFLYVRSPNHAAEISLGEGGFFVEFWGEAEEKSDGPAVRSEIVTSISEVTNKLTEWL
jgi:hypothetical protein